MERRPFIIDCDTGTDDAIALIAAFGSPEITVRAVTSVNGNVSECYTSQNNIDLLEYLGKSVPVAHGAKTPLSVRAANASGTHGNTGLGSLQLPRAVKSNFTEALASELIYNIAVEEQGALELLVLGPMTNIAIALSLYPELRTLIRHMYFMGGAAYGGNVTTTAEFNIWMDPVAAKLVLQSGIPMTMVGLDVTEKAEMLPEDEKELRELGTKAGSLTADLLAFMFERHARGGEAALMHDALALAAAVAPDCLTTKKLFVDVECFGYAEGLTAVDMKGKSGKPANVNVALNLDVLRFRRWLKQAVANCRSTAL